MSCSLYLLEGSSSFILAGNLKALMKDLKIWNAYVFRHINSKRTFSFLGFIIVRGHYYNKYNSWWYNHQFYILYIYSGTIMYKHRVLNNGLFYLFAFLLCFTPQYQSMFSRLSLILFNFVHVCVHTNKEKK